jgi:hypothetical protein
VSRCSVREIMRLLVYIVPARSPPLVLWACVLELRELRERGKGERREDEQQGGRVIFVALSCICLPRFLALLSVLLSFFLFPPFPPFPPSLPPTSQRTVVANAHGGQRGQDERPQALLGALARRQGGARAGISTSPTLSFGGGGCSVVVVCCGGEYGLVKRGSVWRALIPIMYGRDTQGLPLISLPGRRNYKSKSKGMPLCRRAKCGGNRQPPQAAFPHALPCCKARQPQPYDRIGLQLHTGVGRQFPGNTVVVLEYWRGAALDGWLVAAARCLNQGPRVAGGDIDWFMSHTPCRGALVTNLGRLAQS